MFIYRSDSEGKFQTCSFSKASKLSTQLQWKGFMSQVFSEVRKITNIIYILQRNHFITNTKYEELNLNGQVTQSTFF